MVTTEVATTGAIPRMFLVNTIRQNKHVDPKGCQWKSSPSVRVEVTLGTGRVVVVKMLRRIVLVIVAKAPRVTVRVMIWRGVLTHRHAAFSSLASKPVMKTGMAPGRARGSKLRLAMAMVVPSFASQAVEVMVLVAVLAREGIQSTESKMSS